MGDKRTTGVPVQYTGRHSDVEETRTFNTVELARDAFRTGCNRLKDINNWAVFSKGLTAEFALVDGNGAILRRAPAPGDYIRIDLPGPGTSQGDGYDWVQIESVEETGSADSDEQQLIIRVRPSENPYSTNQQHTATTQEDPAHFFNSKATSTFLLHRLANKITAGVHGRNEETSAPESTLDNIRNKMVSSLAALGAARLQWKNLCEGILGSIS